MPLGTSGNGRTEKPKSRYSDGLLAQRLGFCSRQGQISFLHNVQIGCGAYPVTCAMGTGGSTEAGA
jgi:hypothetical protein